MVLVAGVVGVVGVVLQKIMFQLYLSTGAGTGRYW